MIRKPLTGWRCIREGCGMWQPADAKPVLTCCADPLLLRIDIEVPEPEWMRQRRERNLPVGP
jgi:hypothetical protein